MLFNTVLLLFTSAIGIWLGTNLNDATIPLWLRVAFAAWMCGVLLAWYQLLGMPFEISISHDGVVCFRALFKLTLVPVRDIEAIRAWGNVLGGSILRVRHKQGSLKIMYNMAGLADFVGRVKDSNPTVDVRGSWLNPLL